MTDGLLVHGENWQALNLLGERYREEVKCIYIDPPYNTSASAILYKNDYKHSSWLALLESRIRSGLSLLRVNGMLCITIDDAEAHRLRLLIERVLGQESMRGCVSIRSNPSGRATPKGFSIAHEYAIFYAVGDLTEVGRLPHTEKQISRYAEQDEKGRYEWVNFRKHGGANAYRAARPAMYYPIFVGPSGIRIPEMEWHSDKREWVLSESPKRDE
ncbi:MAG TPA: site-specific DNA-methyltransferase, partial [Thermoflexia bacterium]|nr:site-specific DNA-methyltransferase [Thermoflexia bacterium]